MGDLIWKSLEEMPPSQRQRKLPFFPSGWIYFRQWHFARWFLVLSLPVALSVLAAFWRHGFFAALCIAFFGFVLAALLFIVLASGMTSSNWGTYFRSREPVRYWVDVCILIAACIGACAAGWFVK
jgi:hypothetical protein